MESNMILNIVLIVILLILGYFSFIHGRNPNSQEQQASNVGNDNEGLKGVSYKLIVPLKIQALERLLLYLERIQFPVLVKRVFHPVISKNDFQFSLLQNVQDEYEHNLAQRLYVSETTWQLIVLAREEVLQNVNAVFNSNPDADVATIAQKLASLQNQIAEEAVRCIKNEFNSL
jgi:hypothetical protein